MILEITDVRRLVGQDAYEVTGQVGNRKRVVQVDGEKVEERLKQLGARQLAKAYPMRDLAPMIAWMATHDLSEAFAR